MKNLILIAILAMASITISGCANRLHLKCPDCTITNGEFSCNGCQIDAVASRHDGDILAILPPIFKPRAR